MDDTERLAEEAIAETGLSEREGQGDQGGSDRDSFAELLEPDEPVTSLEDMRVSRDEDGDLEPIKVKTLWEGNVIRFLPMSYRDRNKYKLDRRGLLTLSDEERAEFLSDHLLDENGERWDVTVEDLQDFGWTTVDDILNTIGIFSRDHRRDRLPRPVSENGGKEDPGA